MIIYFCLYAFLGYFMESIYISILQRRFISSGLLKGPFIPLYGIGSCVLIFCCPYFQNNISLFIGGGLLMTLVEYIASLYIEKVFHTKSWDYSNHHFHYQGRICLFYFLMWGVLSYILLTYIHPFLSSYIPMNDITLIVALIFLTMILKSFLERLHHEQNKTLLKPKEKESI